MGETALGSDFRRSRLHTHQSLPRQVRSDADFANYAASFAAALEPYKHENIRITPPAPAPIEKIKNKYRYLMTVRGTGLKTIREAIRVLALHRIHPKGIDVAVDVDAQYLM